MPPEYQTPNRRGIAGDMCALGVYNIVYIREIATTRSSSQTMAYLWHAEAAGRGSYEDGILGAKGCSYEEEFESWQQTGGSGARVAR